MAKRGRGQAPPLLYTIGLVKDEGGGKPRPYYIRAKRGRRQAPPLLYTG